MFLEFLSFVANKLAIHDPLSLTLLNVIDCYELCSPQAHTPDHGLCQDLTHLNLNSKVWNVTLYFLS